MKALKLNSFVSILCCFLALLLLTEQARIQAQPKDRSQTASRQELRRLGRLEAQFEQLRRLLKIPGMSAAIMKDDHVLWAKGFGYADVEKRTPATPRTLYYIASITKTFAATALMQLVEQGKLDLDDPMSKYSDDFKDDSVKVKHVLSHTADSPPGDRFRYDGARYAKLTTIIEKKTGHTFRDLLTEMFLDPLKMTDSVPSQDALKVAPTNAALYDREKLGRYRRSLARYAKPYRRYGDEVVQTSNPWEGVSSAAGLLSTVLDLTKFVMAIDRHVYLKPETQARAWTPFTSNSGTPLRHGLGWFVQEYQGVKCIWHFGNAPDGFSGTLVKVPDRGLTLILLANSDALSTPFLRSGVLLSSAFVASFMRLFVFEDRVGHELSDPNWAASKADFETTLEGFRRAATGYTYEVEQRGGAAVRDWINNKRRALKAVAVDPQSFEAYLGEYELPNHDALIVSREGNHLYIQTRGEDRIELFAESSTRFFAKAVDLELSFDKGADGKVSQMVVYQRNTLILRKLR